MIGDDKMDNLKGFSIWLLCVGVVFFAGFALILGVTTFLVLFEETIQ
jgi:hypothetical protein